MNKEAAREELKSMLPGWVTPNMPLVHSVMSWAERHFGQADCEDKSADQPRVARFRMDSYANAESVISGLAFNGHKVWTEPAEKGFYLCVEAMEAGDDA